MTLSLIACGSQSVDKTTAPTTYWDISKYTTNMCTQFSGVGESCKFNGGKVIKFGDGSVYITGTWIFAYSGGSDTDHDEHSISSFIGKDNKSTSLVLSTLVARGTGYKQVCLTYERPAGTTLEVLRLIFDTDGNGTCDSTDYIITPLTLTQSS